MTKVPVPTVGFVGWNPFQLMQVRRLIQAMPGSSFVLESRKDYVSEFHPSLLSDPDVPVMLCKQGKVNSLDGVFDVLVFQTPFANIHLIKSSKIAMLQYGYAKEAHNYGAWRSFADLNLVYGDYAARKIGMFSPALAIGNPRFDDWHNPSWHAMQEKKFSPTLNPARKTVLYAPTWGDLSSVDQYLDEILNLSDKYNVLLKMHHNTEILEPTRKSRILRGNVHCFGANDDLIELLSVTDVFISDYSGAIFDAVFCGKPIVLLNGDFSAATGNKLDNFSIEYSRRSEIGLEVNDQRKLRECVQLALDNFKKNHLKNTKLKEELFVSEPNATERAVDAIYALANSETLPEQMHHYVRKEMADLYNTKLALGAANKKIKLAADAANKKIMA